MRTLPHNLDAERAVLGAILIENTMFAVAASILHSDDFFRDAHRRIFNQITKLSERGAEIDLVILKAGLERAGDLEEVGGPAYIASLVDGVPRSTNVEYYARVVKENATRRRLLALARTLEEGAHTDEDLRGLLERVTNAGDLALGGDGNRGRELPPSVSLRELLALPRHPLGVRIDRWQPTTTRLLIAAQYKSGKTTLVNNTIQCLVDGNPFLGLYTVVPVDGAVAVLDFEMSPQMGPEWLAAQGIVNDDRVFPFFLRGRATDVDLLDPSCRRAWARKLRTDGVKYLFWDCARPLVDALGLDENRDAGRLLTAFDALLDEAGIPEACVVQHMGHNGERARGDSRFRDWPDVEWRLVRKDENPDSTRFISAYGRDVHCSESELSFDPETRRLTISGGSRRDARIDAAIDAVVEVIGHSELSGRAVKTAFRDSEIPRQTIEDALVAGVQSGRLLVTEGPKRARIYSVSRSVPALSRPTPEVCPALFKSGTHGTHDSNGSVSHDQNEGEVRV